MWKFKTEAKVFSSPAVADAMVYFANWDENLYGMRSATSYNMCFAAYFVRPNALNFAKPGKIGQKGSLKYCKEMEVNI